MLPIKKEYFKSNSVQHCLYHWKYSFWWKESNACLQILTRILKKKKSLRMAPQNGKKFLGRANFGGEHSKPTIFMVGLSEYTLKKSGLGILYCSYRWIITLIYRDLSGYTLSVNLTTFSPEICLQSCTWYHHVHKASYIKIRFTHMSFFTIWATTGENLS